MTFGLIIYSALIFGGQILSYSLLIINNGVMLFVWGSHGELTSNLQLLSN